MGSFIIPRELHHGLGTLEKLAELKGKKAVIVTGAGSMVKTGVVDRVKQYLEKAGIATALFTGVEPDPSIETVMKGVELMVAEQPDWIIGLGGCSAIDAAKCMWVFYEYPETKFEDIIPPFTIKPLRKKAQFVAIPSTSGTGTEVTCAAVITDRAKGVKYPLVSYEITPDIAIVDGELCVSMPAHVTAHTGLDALAHDVEAYVSTVADLYTDTLVKESVRQIFKYLPEAYNDGNNLEARQAMHDASCFAGMAFTNALLGIVHAMAHQLGGMFGIPHGCANALLMPNIIRYNAKCTKKYNDLAQLFGGQTAEDFAKMVEDLRDRTGVPTSIRAYGIEEGLWNEKLDEITANAMTDACCGTNPRQATAEDMKKIYAYTFEGKQVDF